MLIDSHCHLGFESLGAYDSSKSLDILTRATENNVRLMIDIATNVKSFQNSLDFSQDKNNVVTAIGVHPLNVLENKNFKDEDILQYLNNPKLVGIGETGLDNYRGSNEIAIQKKYFEQHCQIASSTSLPIIVHTREAQNDTLDILSYFVKNHNLKGLIHCFGEDVAFAKKVLDIGFYTSFSGILTFKNAKDIQEAAKFVPIDRILLETDSPYLAPNPHRGKDNEPSFIKYTYEYLAYLRNMDNLILEKAVEDNFFTLFPKAAII